MTASFIRISLVFAFLAIFSSCTTPGAKEFEVYETSFNTAFELGQSILDRVAAKEREAFDLTVPSMTPTNAYFDPNEARYLVNDIDPPGTAALRQTLRIVQLYNASLSGLASGDSAQIMSARITEIGTTATSLGLQLSTPASTTQAQIIERLAEKTTPLRALEPLSNLALESATRAEFRERLLAEAGTIDSILESLIQITGNSQQTADESTQINAGRRACTETVKPSIFCMLLAPTLFEKDSARGTIPFTADEIKDVNNTRALLANWVILLSNTRVSLAAAVKAVGEGRSPSSSSELLGTLTELDIAARGVRAALAQ